ncbi:MAG: biopolymer transporter ExbD [Lentisphaeria bacterium]|nr:biopolymer transporter ExbD [Lentisphaeria bacterium]
MNFRKKTPPQQTGFQMAPMIDIMFLLLIFFMAAAMYAQWETKMDVTVPTASSGIRANRQQGEVIVNIDPDGTVVLNSFKLDPDQLRERLTNVAELYPDQAIIIRADRATDHEHVMAVLDTCRLAGIWNIAFAALPEKDE